MKDDILAAYVGLKLSLKRDLDGRGHTEPGKTGCHTGGHIGRADAGGKGTQRTVGAGVGVSTDDDLTGGTKAFFGQQSVLYAHLTHIKKVRDVVLVSKGSCLFTELGRLDILAGRVVIQHNGDLILIKDLCKTGLFKLGNGNRRCDIVAQYEIQLCFDQLSRFYLIQTGSLGEDFLCHGHSHRNRLLYYY